MPRDYAGFKEKNETLANYISETSIVMDNISLPRHAEGLRQLCDKVRNDVFSIQVVGTFKNGKSTLINALLGEEIAPVDVLPCTAIVTEIKYGETKSAKLFFRDPLPENLDESKIPDITLDHMIKSGMHDVPPMEIEYDQVSSYVKIPINLDDDVDLYGDVNLDLDDDVDANGQVNDDLEEPEKESAEEIAFKSPYHSVVMTHPSLFLKDGIEIVDTPGLNENDERTKVTLDSLDRADAIIFLFDATHACAKNEMETIRSILIPKGFKDIFFVANKFDCIKGEAAKRQLILYVRSRLHGLTTNETFFISAADALEGVMNNDRRLVEKSGFVAFENSLREYLTNNRGRVKLTRPASELQNIIKDALDNVIPNQRRAFYFSVADIESRHEKIKAQLLILNTQKENLNNQLNLKVGQEKIEIRKAVVDEFNHIAKLVPDWIESYGPIRTKLGLIAKKKKVKELIEEILSHVQEKVKEEFNTWSEETLAPLIRTSVENIFKSSDDSVKMILDSLEGIQVDISGGDAGDHIGGSGWTRALGVAGICCGFTSGVTLLSGEFNIAELAKSVAVDVGLGTLISILGLSNPILCIPFVIAVIWNSIIHGHASVINKTKAELKDKIPANILEKAESKAEEIVKKADSEFTNVVSAAINVIDLQIQDVLKQSETILDEKRRGEDYSNLLDENERRLRGVRDNLDGFIRELAEMV